MYVVQLCLRRSVSLKREVQVGSFTALYPSTSSAHTRIPSALSFSSSSFYLVQFVPSTLGNFVFSPLDSYAIQVFISTDSRCALAPRACTNAR